MFLQGVRVLDMSRILAGPWSTQLLADFGAEVIKVERPGAGDDTRAAGPPFLMDTEGRATRESAYYMSANRGKKSITLDFTRPEGLEILRTLIAESDVLVENYKVGTLARYGLDYESVKRMKPDIVYCSITGFGQTGPLHHRPGYDFIFQGMSGLMSITGERDDLPGGGPQKVGVAYMDLTTGMYATVAMLAALHHKRSTGEGQHIDLALLDVAVCSLANMVSNFLVSGVEPKRMGNAHANLVPYGVFPASDGHIILAIGNDEQFRSFCRVAGREDLSADERYATNPGRIRNRETLIPVMEAITASRGMNEWIALLDAVNVSCGPINSISQALDNEQIRHRKVVREVAHPQGGRIPMVGNPVKFSAAELPMVAPPLLGQHTEDILTGLCGMPLAKVEELRKAGVL